jgi:hypothetical protein
VSAKREKRYLGEAVLRALRTRCAVASTECGKLVDCGPVGWLPCDWPIGHPMRCAPSEDSTRKAVAAMPDPICGCVCCCGPNLEPLACGYKRGHDGAHAWGTLPSYPPSKDTKP